VTATPARRDGFVSSWLLWTVGFVSFPIAGVVALLVVDRVDSPVAALVGGSLTGAVIGAGQWLVSRRRLRLLPWLVASTVGMGVGLLLGATVVGFGTTLADLALMGAVSGAALGVGQALALSARVPRRWWWAAAMPVLWSLGWVVSTAIGIAVEEQFSVFGSSGAIVFSALSGLLLAWVLPRVRVSVAVAPAADRRRVA
jgi:MFS family permease